jgi:endoglucanase
MMAARNRNPRSCTKGMAMLLLLGAAAMACSSAKSAKDLGKAPRGRLRVADGKLLDGNGEPIALKGLGFAAIADAKAANKWNEDWFANARAWNAELIRLPVNPVDFRKDPAQILLDLDDALRWCEKHGMYLIVDYHVIGNATQGLFQFADVLSTTWPEAEAFWAAVADRYAEQPTVAFFEIYNEPAALEYMGGSWTFADWRQHADALVAVVRKHAPKAIPVVAGLNWAYDLSAGGEQPFADPDIALAAHPYPGRAKSNRRAAWESAFGYLGARYPFILTEFGFDPDDQIEPYGTYRADVSYGREILHYAQEKNMSWTPFVFFNASGWPMPLFSDWETLTPTYSGQFFKDVLSGKDIDQSGATASDAAPDHTAPTDATSTGGAD